MELPYGSQSAKNTLNDSLYHKRGQMRCRLETNELLSRKFCDLKTLTLYSLFIQETILMKKKRVGV